MPSKKITKSNTLKKEAIVEALKKSLGVVTPACDTVGITRTTFYRWIKEDAEFAANVADVKEVAVDYAETKLHDQIRDGNTTAIIFYLKTQGKKRGYVERMEQSVSVKDHTALYRLFGIDDTQDEL